MCSTGLDKVGHLVDRWIFRRLGLLVIYTTVLYISRSI